MCGNHDTRLLCRHSIRQRVRAWRLPIQLCPWGCIGAQVRPQYSLRCVGQGSTTLCTSVAGQQGVALHQGEVSSTWPPTWLVLRPTRHRPPTAANAQCPLQVHQAPTICHTSLAVVPCRHVSQNLDLFPSVYCSVVLSIVLKAVPHACKLTACCSHQ